MGIEPFVLPERKPELRGVSDLKTFSLDTLIASQFPKNSPEQIRTAFATKKFQRFFADLDATINNELDNPRHEAFLLAAMTGMEPLITEKIGGEHVGRKLLQMNEPVFAAREALDAIFRAQNGMATVTTFPVPVSVVPASDAQKQPLLAA